MERHSSCRLRVGAHGGYRRRLVRAAFPSRGVREGGREWFHREAMMAKATAKAKPKGEHPLLRRLSKICLSLTEAGRRDRNDHADFLNNQHGDGNYPVCCKSALGENVDRPWREPARFYLPAYIGPRGWFGLRLDRGAINWSEVENIVELSYRLVAPKTLLRVLDAQVPTAGRR